MSNVVMLPPDTSLLGDGAKAGGWWHTDEQAGRIICDLCPRACSLKAGDRGFCFVRENRGGRMVLTTYGRSTGFCVDPIEKNRSITFCLAPVSCRLARRAAISAVSFARTGRFPSHVK